MDLLIYLINSVIIQGLYQGGEPFFRSGMKIMPSAISTHGARIGTSPLAIVELILKKLPTTGTPGEVLYKYLQGSFASNLGDIKYVQHAFNIDPNNLELHRRKMSSITAALKK
jgi:hypothetical protein